MVVRPLYNITHLSDPDKTATAAADGQNHHSSLERFPRLDLEIACLTQYLASVAAL